jgi:hypothetical protein
MPERQLFAIRLHRVVAMMGRMMFDERSCGEPGSDLS